jgi:phosphonate transport system permease protein
VPDPHAPIVPPAPPARPYAALRSGVKWVLIALGTAYCVASFAATDFNLYKLQTGIPKALPVLQEIVHPDLGWDARNPDGTLKTKVIDKRLERQADGSVRAVPVEPPIVQRAPGTLRLLLGEMNETVMTSLAGTLLAVLLSFPLCFFAAGNLMRSPAGRVAYGLTRALFNVTRAFPPYILAIIFVIVVGTGPFAGVLALAVHSVGMLGKLYAEAIEGIDPAPVEAVRATGASSLLTVWFGILPQVAGQFIAFSLYRMDMNIRMSIILGIVGAGGIGFLLEQYIRQFQYSRASTAFLIILVAVTLLDWASSWLREKLE